MRASSRRRLTVDYSQTLRAHHATRAELSIWWLVRRRIHLPHPPFQNFARKRRIKMRVNQDLKGVSNLFIFIIAPISAILREVPLLHNIGKQFCIGPVRNT